MTFAVKIRKLRIAAGLNQTQLAEKAGIVQSQVWEYECGIKEPGLQTLCRLWVALKCDARDLLDVEERTYFRKRKKADEQRHASVAL